MKEIIVDQKQSGQRVDKFLKKEIFFDTEKITRGEIIRNIKKGNILVNGEKVKPSFILKKNDEIEAKINVPFFKIEPNEEVKFKIIFQNENIIVIDKPAGLQVHPASATDRETNSRKTLVSGLLFQFPEIEKVGDEPKIRPGIVHRLDKDTSGIMVVARNQKSFEELKNKFKNKEIFKKYLAIVWGCPENQKGAIEKPLARSADYKKQVIARVRTKNKIYQAITEYEVIKKSLKFSFLEIVLKTGRTHQIRAHFLSIGCPIVGDKLYKNNKNKGDRFFLENKSPKRQLLHAQKICFDLFEKKYFFESKMPQDMEEFWKKYT